MSNLVLTVNLRCARLSSAGGQTPSNYREVPDASMGSPLVRLLELLDERTAKATMFVCADQVRHCPGVIRKFAERGHEIGVLQCRNHQQENSSAGWSSPAIANARDALQQLTGQAVDSFRDDAYSLGREDRGNWSPLVAAGFQYDSSVLPYEKGTGRDSQWPRYPFRMRVGNSELVEWPIATARYFGKLFPIGCEWYTEALPYWLLRRSLRSFHSAGWPAIVATGASLPAGDELCGDKSVATRSRFNTGESKWVLHLLNDFHLETLSAATSRLRLQELATLRPIPSPTGQTDVPVARN